MSTGQEIVMWGIFGLTYVGIALGGFPRLVLDRTGVALLGAIAMLAVHGVSVRQAAAHIDYETMLLLFGLMIFSAQLRVAGFYGWTGRFLTRLTDRPKRLLAGVIGVSAILSTLLANDIVCLAFTPLLCQALLAARKNPIPYLLALAMSSNIGSAATIIGNPQNMYIGTVAHLPFGHFAAIMLPMVLVGLLLCWGMIVLMFPRDFFHRVWPAEEAHPALLPAADPVMAEARRHANETLAPSSLPLQPDLPEERDNWLIGKALVLLGLLVIFFLVMHGPQASEWRAIGALAGAGMLLLSHRAKAAKLYQLVDWNLLLLFFGLFVVNGAMKQQGLMHAAFSHLTRSGVDLTEPLTLSAVTAGLSNLVSNVPAVLLLEPTLAQANSAKLWYLLALVSTWAGNLTLVGSIANLIVAESAAAFGVQVRLGTYCRAGIPLTVITVTLGTLWIMVAM